MAVPEKADINSLNVERVRKAVNAELQEKDFIMSSNNPDFLISEHLGRKDKVEVTKWGYGRGAGYYRAGTTSAYGYEEGSLMLDFVDAKSKKLIWRGVAKAVVDNIDTPEIKEQLINEAAQNILKNFPPKSKE